MDPGKEAGIDPRVEMNDNGQHIEVEAYSGYKANERPVAFIFQGRRWEISEILDRWYEGGVNPEQLVVDYFKVKTSDGSVFILRYEAEAEEWTIIVPREQTG
jgi:hypothetical protein